MNDGTKNRLKQTRKNISAAAIQIKDQIVKDTMSANDQLWDQLHAIASEQIPYFKKNEISSISTSCNFKKLVPTLIDQGKYTVGSKKEAKNYSLNQVIYYLSSTGEGYNTDALYHLTINGKTCIINLLGLEMLLNEDTDTGLTYSEFERDGNIAVTVSISIEAYEKLIREAEVK